MLIKGGEGNKGLQRVGMKQRDDHRLKQKCTTAGIHSRSYMVDFYGCNRWMFYNGWPVKSSEVLAYEDKHPDQEFGSTAFKLKTYM